MSEHIEVYYHYLCIEYLNVVFENHENMMKSEIAIADKRIPELEEAIKIALLPTDPNDEKNIILEVRA